MDRLQRLRGLLADGGDVTVAALAARLGVSVRTLMRDLDLLRDDGVLIETDRGRGGGVRLARGHAAGRVQFTANEAMEVLVSLAVSEKLRMPMLGASVKSARQKIAATFSTRDRERIAALRRRVLIGSPASLHVLASHGEIGAAAETARAAFFEMRQLEIRYRDERRVDTTRTIEPQFLLLNPPVWYLLAWDHLRGGVRAFRFDRLLRARMTESTFRLRPAPPFLAAVEAGIESV